MNAFVLRWVPWFFATLAVAVVVHLATIYALPGLIMDRTLAAMTRGGAYNVVRHGTRANAGSRGIVRPSPDLLYSFCAYDLSKGPLKAHALVPPGTYWSVSAFDARTDNFFTRNDRQAKNGMVDFILVGPASSGGALPHGQEFVFSPTPRGLLLFRTLVNDDRRFAEIDSARRHVDCAPFEPGQ